MARFVRAAPQTGDAGLEGVSYTKGMTDTLGTRLSRKSFCTPSGHPPRPMAKKKVDRGVRAAKDSARQQGARQAKAGAIHERGVRGWGNWFATLAKSCRNWVHGCRVSWIIHEVWRPQPGDTVGQGTEGSQV